MSESQSSAQSAGTAVRVAPRMGAVRAPLLQRECSCGGGVGGSCDACKKNRAQEEAKAQLHRSSSSPSRGTAPPSVHRVLSSPGRPLDPGARSFLEPRFGRDFSHVRVHTDHEAAASARAVDAHAYTVGRHIAFDSGQYQPHTSSGRRLLAHELAHTVQQGSVNSTPALLAYGDTPEYNHLENEAEAVAQAVMSRGESGPAAAHAAPPANYTASPARISRAGKTPKTPTPTASNKRSRDADAGSTSSTSTKVKSEASDRDWVSVTTSELKKAGVKAYAFPGKNAAIVAVQMAKPLDLPKQKGPVEDIWKARAAAGALEAIIEPASGEVKTRAGLKQTRPSSSTLRSIWLQKVGWFSKNADAYWKLAGGDSNSYDPPKAGKKTCQVDHILELQFGGNNVPNNMQMLDGEENEWSGREIFNRLKENAEAIKQAFADDGINIKSVKDILVHYDSVKMIGALTGCKCCAVEEKAKTMPKNVDIEKGQSVNAKITGTPFPMKAGSSEVVVIVEDEKAKAVPLAESSVPENKYASTLISGLSLEIWKRPDKSGGTVASSMDNDSRLPISLHPDKKKKLDLHRSKDGSLKLPPGNPNLHFHFDYLSEGVFTHLAVEDDKYLVGSGTVTPSIPWIPKFDVFFDREKFAISKPIPSDKLKLPIPGLKMKPGSIGLELAPEFKPYGTVEFSLDAGKRHLLDGKLEVSADSDGVVAAGDVQVSLPGVDNAAGHMEYRNKQWSGRAEISTSQLQSKLKYIESGQLIVLFDQHGMNADGKVRLKLPGTEGVDARLIYDGGAKRWIFQGKARFHPPGLEQTDIEVTYDGNHLSGSGETGFRFQGIHGTVKVHYFDERFTGEGKLEIKKGKALGSLSVKMREVGGHPIFSGEGLISYEIKPGVVASAGIEVGEDQRVKVKGELEFHKPIHLFDAAKGDYTFFEVGISIPIPGASIGPVGLKAHIDGSLSAGYRIGPGELRNTKLLGTFYPLEDKPDLDLTFTSTVYVGGSAYISGKIEGSVGIDVGVAEVSGGFTITATASLAGFTASTITLHYAQGKFSADADFKLLLGLALTLALGAFVKGKLGVGWFSVSRRKDWTLKSWTFDTGLQFGMNLKKPLHYDSDTGVTLPSLSDINWITPSLEPGRMLGAAFDNASKEGDE